VSDTLSHAGVEPGEHLGHANRLGLPQDASTAVVAGRRGDQAARCLGSWCERTEGPSTDTAARRGEQQRAWLG
jgi:hypothetical protein